MKINSVAVGILYGGTVANGGFPGFALDFDFLSPEFIECSIDVVNGEGHTGAVILFGFGRKTDDQSDSQIAGLKLGPAFAGSGQGKTEGVLIKIDRLGKIGNAIGGIINGEYFHDI